MKARKLYRMSFAVLCLALFGNVALCVVVFVKLRRPVSYHVIVPPDPPVLDRVVSDVVLPLPGPNSVVSSSSSSPVFSNVRVYNLPYDYAVVQGDSAAVISGFPYFEGSLHAYGLIVRIFPERIYFTDGSYIENTKQRNFKNDDRANKIDLL